MGNALQTAGTGLAFQDQNLSVAADNLAKMNVPGFKQSVMIGQSLEYDHHARRVGTVSNNAGNVIPAGVQIGLGVGVAGVTSILSQGSPVVTNNAYHIAIQGQGYFQVELADGTIGYTRDGTFTKNNEGIIVNHSGLVLAPGIAVPTEATSVFINGNGEVFAKMPGVIEPQNLGQIELAIFANPDGLEATSGNLLKETPASGPPVIGQPMTEGYGELLQGHFEGSNVDAVTAVTGLINIQHAFDMNTKSVKTAEKVLEELVRIGA